MSPKIFFAGLLGVALSSVAVTSSAQVVVIRTAPPVEVVESPGRAPSNHHFWMRGHWRWDGRSYAWDRGHWEARRIHSAFVPGHWVRGRAGWFWVDGRWVRG